MNQDRERGLSELGARVVTTREAIQQVARARGVSAVAQQIHAATAPLRTPGLQKLLAATTTATAEAASGLQRSGFASAMKSISAAPAPAWAAVLNAPPSRGLSALSALGAVVKPMPELTPEQARRLEQHRTLEEAMRMLQQPAQVTRPGVSYLQLPSGYTPGRG